MASLSFHLQSILSFVREIEPFGGKVLSITEGVPDTCTLGLINAIPVPEPECEACGEFENLSSDGCTVGELICNGEVYDRVKVGDEADIYTQLTENGRCQGASLGLDSSITSGASLSVAPPAATP